MESVISFIAETDFVPKPEDAGKLKISLSVVISDTTIGSSLSFFISAPCVDSSEGIFVCNYDLEKLNDWLCLAGLPHQSVFYAKTSLFRLISAYIPSVFSSTYAVLLNMTIEVYPPPPIEETIQASFDETTNNIPFRPASKLAVDSLPRKVYENNEKKALSSVVDTMCTICLEEFKNGQAVVTLPCGHEFDDTCIVEWFSIGYVCPLCRFELPCENIN